MTEEEFAKLLGYETINELNEKIQHEGGMDYWINEYQSFEDIPKNSNIGKCLFKYFIARNNLMQEFDELGITDDYIEDEDGEDE